MGEMLGRSVWIKLSSRLSGILWLSLPRISALSLSLSLSIMDAILRHEAGGCLHKTCDPSMTFCGGILWLSLPRISAQVCVCVCLAFVYVACRSHSRAANGRQIGRSHGRTFGGTAGLQRYGWAMRRSHRSVDFSPPGERNAACYF